MKECKHCKQQFDTVDKPRGWMANHSRWCLSNPKRSMYGVSHLTSPCAMEKKKKTLSRLHQEGRYVEAQRKSALSRRGLHPSEVTRKTLSDSARRSPHRRLRRKMILYKGIMLDSTWELALARRLDSIGVFWARPEPIQWVDEDGVAHHYFPDFYLPNHDRFLDPKNPRAMVVQRCKIEILQNSVPNLVFIETLKECESYTP